MIASEAQSKTQPKTLLIVFIAAAIILALAGGGGYWYYAYGPCGVSRVNQGLAEFERIFTRWSDATNIASNTARVSLSGPVGELQSIHRELDDLELPSCLAKSQELLGLSMQNTVNGFLAFMAQEKDEDVNYLFTMATASLKGYQDEVLSVKACAPLCQ